MMQILKKNLLGLLSLTSVLFALSGCEEQIDNVVAPSPEDKLVTVSLNFGFADNNSDEFSRNGSPQRLAATARVESGTAAFNASRLPPVLTRSSTDAPDQLYNLEIRQYDSNGNHLTGTDFGSTAQGIGTNLNISLQQNADCQLVVVARGSGGAVSALGTQSLSNVQNMNVSSSTINAITPGNMNAMPYVLHLPHVKVTAAGKLQSIDGAYDTRLLLKRLATRLTVNWTYNVSGYKLKQLLLQSIPLNFAVVDKPDGTDGTYPSLVSQFTTLEVPVTDANAASGSYSCWVPANVRGESAAATSDLQRTKANAPTGSAFLNFVAVNTTDVKKKLDYRVYIGSGASTDFNMYRNKEYAYTVNFNHVGIPTGDQRVTYIDPVPASENNNVVPTANCFMVAPGGSFCFDPFAFQQNGAEITNTQMTGWYSAADTGIKSVKLLWQTKENGDVGESVMGIANSAADQTNIVDIKRTDNGDIVSSPANGKGQCRIYCRMAANTTGGNGAIAAYDGPNGTGNIVWSWHIWVTNYSPDATGNVDVQEPATKRKQKYVGNSAPDQYPMMDRNLGAINGYKEVPATVLEQSKANGFHYQQGRKDPFPSSYSSEASPSIDNIYNSTPPKGMLNLYGADGITYIPRDRQGINSLQEAYRHPMRLNTVNGTSDTQGYQWGGNLKTLHDPCPAGWRVPTNQNYQALFSGTYLSPGSAVAKYTPRLPSGFAWNDGERSGGYVIVYDNDNHTTYFRMTGFGNSSNSFVIVGQAGNIWTRDYKYTFNFGFNANASRNPAYSVSPTWISADAHNTRCIQERVN